MADHFTHFSSLLDGAPVIDLGARKSIGWPSTQEWLAPGLYGENPHA
jgi:hypothetical protein